MRLVLRQPVLLMFLALSGCSETQSDSQTARGVVGLTAIQQLGCGACHDVPGVAWPKSNVGPTLENYGKRSLIVGIIPNTPDNLAAFVQNASRFVPEGAMPPIAMTQQQAADIASYLLSLQDEG